MTNWDVNSYAVLSAGGSSRSDLGPNGWQSMDSAPRDGTWVELKCTYGVAPWYCIARWTDEGLAHGVNGLVPYKKDKPEWVKRDGGGPASESSLFWRPYEGDVEAYSDPTGGLQNSPAYWRGAVAAKHSLPLDYFEETTAQNIKQNKIDRAGDDVEKPKSWLRRTLDSLDFG